MSYLNFLIKPASGLCNMRCRYCFYEDEIQHRTLSDMAVMSEETAEILIRKAFAETTPGDVISFAFQGGEPTLAGISFFRFFTAKVREYNTQLVPVLYSIQTNGLNIDADWIDLFLEHRFLVGVSVDGTEAIHDAYRRDAQGHGTYRRVTEHVRAMIRAGVEVNILCVVTAKCAASPRSVYDALKKLGSPALQMITCLDPLEQTRGTAAYSLLPDAYGHFLCELFDCWYADLIRGIDINIRFFDDLIRLAMGYPAGTCATAGTCGVYHVIEADGSIYPCDFYVLDEWRIGSIYDMNVTDILSSETEQRFLQESLRLPDDCSTCKWKHYCHGGCRRDRMITNNTNAADATNTSDAVSGTSGRTGNYYCRSFQMLYKYADGRIQSICKKIRERQH